MGFILGSHFEGTVNVIKLHFHMEEGRIYGSSFRINSCPGRVNMITVIPHSEKYLYLEYRGLLWIRSTDMISQISE